MARPDDHGGDDDQHPASTLPADRGVEELVVLPAQQVLIAAAQRCPMIPRVLQS
ncbi:hypothetical protein [Gordonia bronchialis]|uniref:hypothetical protein n=1 Tax=Gordonia bronchialis TaxID=2054 RepID=UPI001D13DD96|nr:hypothetical protein [Gordonia bronchialis]MCC3322904.1 hypothetical protein [Gordonia bronchialis]